MLTAEGPEPWDCHVNHNVVTLMSLGSYLSSGCDADLHASTSVIVMENVTGKEPGRIVIPLLMITWEDCGSSPSSCESQKPLPFAPLGPGGVSCAHFVDIVVVRDKGITEWGRLYGKS